MRPPPDLHGYPIVPAPPRPGSTQQVSPLCKVYAPRLTVSQRSLRVRSSADAFLSSGSVKYLSAHAALLLKPSTRAQRPSSCRPDLSGLAAHRPLLGARPRGSHHWLRKTRGASRAWQARLCPFAWSPFPAFSARTGFQTNLVPSSANNLPRFFPVFIYHFFLLSVRMPDFF